VRAQAKKGKPETQMAFFSDFNGIAFEDLVDFYRHEQNWANRMILGDSLLVMTSLAEKEGLQGPGADDLLDPPYGIKFGSNWQVSTRKRDVKDGKPKTPPASRSKSKPSAIHGSWHPFVPWLTCATDWLWRASC